MNTKTKSIIKEFRKNWQRGNGDTLSYGNKYKTDDEVFENVGLSAYNPSIIRAGTDISKIKTQDERNKLKKEAAKYISAELHHIYPKKCTSFKQFTKWAYKVASCIRKLYQDNGVTKYTYGNAQKLINMAIKYMLSSNRINEKDPLFKYCHIPVDSIIQKKFHKDLKVPYLKGKTHSWSKNDDWNEFVEYQKNVINATKADYYSPLIAEIENWKPAEQKEK